jgi:hypothetical protein
MIVARAEAAEHDTLFIGAIVAVRVLEKQQLGPLAHVSAAVAEFEPRGNHQPLGEDRRLVRVARVLRVLQNHDPVVRLLAGLELRVSRGAEHPQSAARIPADLDRLHHALLFTREEIRLEALGQLEAREFRSGIILIHFRARGHAGRRKHERCDFQKRTRDAREEHVHRTSKSEHRRAVQCRILVATQSRIASGSIPSDVHANLGPTFGVRRFIAAFGRSAERAACSPPAPPTSESGDESPHSKASLHPLAASQCAA